MRIPFNLPDQKEFDAVGFGLNAVDHLLVVSEYPAFDTKTRFTSYEKAAGGQTASAMVALQRLGMQTAYAGRFGSDEAGRFGLLSLEYEGVNLEFAETIAGADNQVAFIIIEERTGERTIIWDRDDRLSYRADEAPIDFATCGRVLHLDAHDPPACAVMARAAHPAGAIVTADIDNIYEGLPELLPLIDVLIGSSEFPERLTGISDLQSSIVEIKSRYGCTIVGATLGSRGAVVYLNDQFIESPAFAVPGGCRDTTGAGDAFHAGFIYGMLRDEELETCMKLGNAVAALKCRALGGRFALPTADELNEFLVNATPFNGGS
ncbi:MAG TPA: carbohydrate kinase family protein [Pyrinomonadaceae bacterium]|nr:carbohydrate kinase family protein [Pyrinomonadaceae bacterium]